MGILLLRKSKGLSGLEVAARMNIHPSYYSHLETGRRKFTPELVQELAKALEEPVDFIRNKVNQIDDQVVLTRSWVLGIKIHGQNIVRAFENELLLDRPKDIKKEIKERLARFIEKNIAQSVMTEIDNDGRLQHSLIMKFKHLEEKKT